VGGRRGERAQAREGIRGKTVNDRQIEKRERSRTKVRLAIFNLGQRARESSRKRESERATARRREQERAQESV